MLETLLQLYLVLFHAHDVNYRPNHTTLAQDKQKPLLNIFCNRFTQIQKYNIIHALSNIAKDMFEIHIIISYLN